MTSIHTRLTALMMAFVLLWVGPTAHAFSTCRTTALTTAVSSLPEEQQDPATAGANDIYFSYRDNTGLVFKQSHDAGKTWAQSVLDINGYLPRVVAVQKHVYVTWFSYDGTNGSLNFAHSEDAGTTFAPTQNLGPSTHEIAQVATSGPLVSIIWTAGSKQVEIASSVNAGKTFTNVELHSLPNAEEVWIAASGKNISVVWTGTGTDGYAKNIVSFSKDGGKTFAVPKKITVEGLSDIEPQMAVSDTTGALYMVFREEHSSYGSSVGFISKSTDFGETWSTPQVLDANDTRARQFAIAASGNNVYVVYMSYDSDRDWKTQLRISKDGGAHFGQHILLGLCGIRGNLGDEAHAPRVWADGAWMRVIYDWKGWVSIRSSNNDGTLISPPTKLGGGDQMLLARNSALWLDDNGMAMFGLCR
jgi:hypothetical protein